MMPTELIEFLLRQSTIWLSLLLFYSLAFRKNDHWSLKRYFLIIAYLAGWLIPLLPALNPATITPIWQPSDVIVPSLSIMTPIEMQVTKDSYPLSLTTILLVVYLVGCAYQLFKLVYEYHRIRIWSSTGDRSFYEHLPVIKHAGISMPFSGFNTIYLPDHFNPQEEQLICLHESCHIQRCHNWERFPMVLGSILLWFHPLQPLFIRWLSELQEYEADQKVLTQFPLKAYGQLIIQASILPVTGWRAQFNSSPLKRRIMTMKKKKSHRPMNLRQLFILAILSGLIVISCSDLLRSDTLPATSNQPQVEVDQLPSLISDESSVSTADAEKAILQHLYKEIKYPAIARSNQVEALIPVAFTIGTDGKIADLTILREKAAYHQPVKAMELVVIGYMNPPTTHSEGSKAAGKKALEEEVLRTVQTLPDWNPAIKDGQQVPVSMQFHLRFKLQQ